MIVKHLCHRHIKTLWWWQRVPTIRAVGECLQCFLDTGDKEQVIRIVNRFKGKQRFVLMLCMRDCLRYIRHVGDQLSEVRGDLSDIQNRLNRLDKLNSEQSTEQSEHDMN